MCGILQIAQKEEDSDKPKPTRLAIGVEGGFDVDNKKFEYEEHHSVVVLPDWIIIPLPDTALPAEVCTLFIYEAYLKQIYLFI